MDTLWVWGFCSFVSPHSYRSLFYRTPASLAKQGCVPQWNGSAETGRALHLQTSVTPPLNTLSYTPKHRHQCPWLPERCHLNYLIWQSKECIHTRIETRTHSQGNERVSHKELRAPSDTYWHIRVRWFTHTSDVWQDRSQHKSKFLDINFFTCIVKKQLRYKDDFKPPVCRFGEGVRGTVWLLKQLRSALCFQSQDLCLRRSKSLFFSLIFQTNL